MKPNLTMLAVSLGLSVFAVNAQTLDLGPDTTGYRRFLVYPHLEKGFNAMARNDRQVALTEFEQALALAPDNPVIALHLAHALRRFNQSERAEVVLREQLQRNPGNARLTDALADLSDAPPKNVRLAQSVPLPAPAAVLAMVPAASPPATDNHVAALSYTPSMQQAAGTTHRQAAPVARKAVTVASRRVNAAYALADKAYKLSAQNDHPAAVRAAREALRLMPANRAYRSLLVYELSETDQLEEADTVASYLPPDAGAARPDDELVARQKMVRQHIAFKHFDAANQAAAASKADTAVESARKGIDYAPELLSHRLQLVGFLMSAQQWPQAEQTANEAIRDIGPQPALLVLRAYLLQRLNQRTGALDDLDHALAAPALSVIERRNFRLMAADAALEAGEPKKALDVLEPALMAQGGDDGIAARRTLAFQAFRRNSVASNKAPLWIMPKVICVGNAFSASCEVWPGENPPDLAYPVADAAYKAFSAKNYELAVAKTREAVQLSPTNLQYRLLLVNSLVASEQLAQADQEATAFLAASSGNVGEMLALRSRVRHGQGQESLAMLDAEQALLSGDVSAAGEMGLLVQLNRNKEARERFNVALRDGSFADQPEVDTAYLAVQAGDDDAALAAFERASRASALPDQALQDAAYAAGRLGRNKAAVGYFERTVDAAASGQLPLTPQQLFSTRRFVADRTRTVGAYGSLTYRGVGVSGLSLTPGASDDSLQAGLEAYWRPFGNGDGRLLEVYGGLAGTLYSKAELPTGASTVQGAFGVRVKPLVETNLILAVERRLKIGSQAQTDWLARVGYSNGLGQDLRVDAPDWWTTQLYAEAGRFIKLKQNYATFEGQAGRSFRLDAIHPKLVIFPHLVFGADRNDGYGKGREKAVSAGAGATLRYWFNEDKYTAPRSYWDMSLQYRGRISGDDRAKGVFLRFTLSY